jgi:hypothetical protein
MIPDFFNYKTSILNPVLKFIAPFILLYGVYFFYKARKMYSYELKKLMTLLMVTGIFGFLATLFRFLGDYLTMWKWGESLAFLVFGLVSVYSAWQAAGPLSSFVRQLLSENSGSKVD